MGLAGVKKNDPNMTLPIVRTLNGNAPTAGQQATPTAQPTTPAVMPAATGESVGEITARLGAGRADRRAEMEQRRATRSPLRETGGLGGVMATAAERMAERKAARDAAAAAGGTGGATTGTPGPAGTTTSVADRISDIISDDSELMRLAAARGLQAVNARGLGNSSMGVGAAQKSVIETAAPIAGQDAQIASSEKMATEERQSRERIAANELKVRQAESAADRAQQATQFNQQLEFNTSEMNARIEMFEGEMAQRERDNLAANITQMNAQRMSAYGGIMSNPEIPAEARSAALRSINDMTTQNFNQLQSLYGVTVSSATPQPANTNTLAPSAPSIAYSPTHPYVDVTAERFIA